VPAVTPCCHRTGWTRVIVEKPFGRDSDSSRELGRGLAKHLNEDQIYRIDHYLGMKVTQAFCIGGAGWTAAES
jgi:glucose-6-phosphate 1-dehydrogenase